jgi:hypothetical protein
MKFSKLEYDIHKDIKGIYPGALLRNRAVRTSGSVWVIPTAEIPWSTLQKWTEKGVTWHAWEHAESESKKIQDYAANKLAKGTEEAVASAQKSIDAAATKLAEDGDLDAYDYTVERAVDRIEAALVDFQDAAKAFNLAPTVVPVAETRKRAMDLKKLADLRASTFSKLVAEMVAKRVPGAAAAAADRVPAAIAMDMADDAGIDTKAVRGAFAD